MYWNNVEDDKDGETSTVIVPLRYPHEVSVLDNEKSNGVILSIVTVSTYSHKLLLSFIFTV